jgi:WD40 repeat protein
MHSAFHPTISHYQLRNMMACRNQLQLVYADGKASKVYSTLPYNSTRSCVIDLSHPNNSTAYVEPVQISCLGLSTDIRRSVVVVGGMNGELTVQNLESQAIGEGGKDHTVVFDWATKGNAGGCGIINHIDVDVYASRGQFSAVVACNDRKIRTYDIQTSTWLHAPGKKNQEDGGTESGWLYPWAINCTAASPDGKLREWQPHTRPLLPLTPC